MNGEAKEKTGAIGNEARAIGGLDVNGKGGLKNAGRAGRGVGQNTAGAMHRALVKADGQIQQAKRKRNNSSHLRSPLSAKVEAVETNSPKQKRKAKTKRQTKWGCCSRLS
jgi:hypothetical protein